jgi:hypothetical protein
MVEENARDAGVSGIRRGREGAADTTQTFGHDSDLSFIPFGSDLTEAELEAIGASVARALLLVRSGPTAGARYLLDTDVTTVGRHPEADIFFDDVTVSSARRDHPHRRLLRARRSAFPERQLRQRRARRPRRARRRLRGAHRQVPAQLLRSPVDRGQVTSG